MAKDSVIVGIDIGSSNVRTVIAQQSGADGKLRIIGVGSSVSSGIRRGAIVDVNDAAKSVFESIDAAQRMAGIQVRGAAVNIGGCEVGFQQSKGVVAVGKADGEVTNEDVSRVIGEAQVIPLPMNKEIVHVIPRKYRLDDNDNISDPVGMKGVRLEIDALIIETSSNQVKNLGKCAYQDGFEIEDIVLEPLAAAQSVLTKKQKELGVVLVNIGGGTTSVAVYEEGELLHTNILPVGAGHITNDIAIGLRTSVDVAEKIKLEYGCAIIDGIDKKEGIDLSLINSQETDVVSRHHVAEIIEARMEEILSLVQNELKKIGKAGLLPSGAVLVGGGAKLPGVNELAKRVLGLPITVGFPFGFGGILDKVDDPAFATASGLLLWEIEQGQSMEGLIVTKGSNKAAEIITKGAGETVEKLKRLFSKFLP